MELVTKLAHARRSGNDALVLVDHALGHIWKPRLHEIATAMQSAVASETSYLGHAKAHGYYYEMGSLQNVDPQRRLVQLAPLTGPNGEPVLPARAIAYGRLVLAIGSGENDFGTPGARAHCLFLNSTADATRIRDALLLGAFRTARGEQTHFSVVVIGGGATGVELSAEIHHALDAMGQHEAGLDCEKVRVTIVEGADRLLSANPPQVSTYAAHALAARGVELVLGDRVARVDHQGVVLKSGRRIEAQLRIWTAGIQGPAALKNIESLPRARSGRVAVDQQLRCQGMDAIYAIGDCAEWLDPNTGTPAPYTAQVASAQARYLARSFQAQCRGGEPSAFDFQSAGAIVSLGDRGAAGNLTTRFGRHSRDQIVQGFSAKLLYSFLYRRHELAVHGWRGAAARWLSEALARAHQPELKLH